MSDFSHLSTTEKPIVYMRIVTLIDYWAFRTQSWNNLYIFQDWLEYDVHEFSWLGNWKLKWDSNAWPKR